MATCVVDMDTYLSSMEKRKEVCNKTSATSIFAAVSSASTMFVDSLVSNAGPSATPAPKIGDKDVKTFMDDLEKGEVVADAPKKLETVNKTVVGMTGEVYSIVKSAGLILVLVFCIISIVKLAGSSGSSANEGKSGLIKGALAICMLGALASFVGLAFNVGSTLF